MLRQRFPLNDNTQTFLYFVSIGLQHVTMMTSSSNMTLLAFATERRAAAPLLLSAGAVDRHFLPADPPLLLSIDGTEKTDERTDGRWTVTYRPCAAYFAGGVKNP